MTTHQKLKMLLLKADLTQTQLSNITGFRLQEIFFIIKGVRRTPHIQRAVYSVLKARLGEQVPSFDALFQAKKKQRKPRVSLKKISTARVNNLAHLPDSSSIENEAKQ